MSDLRAALDKYNEQLTGPWHIPSWAKTLAAATRGVIEADIWRVCEVHGSANALGFKEKCDAYEAMLLNGTPFTNHCVMVHRPLLKPVETRRDADPSGASPVS